MHPVHPITVDMSFPPSENRSDVKGTARRPRRRRWKSARRLLATSHAEAPHLNHRHHSVAVVPCPLVTHRAGQDHLVSQRSLARIACFDFG